MEAAAKWDQLRDMSQDAELVVPELIYFTVEWGVRGHGPWNELCLRNFVLIWWAHEYCNMDILKTNDTLTFLNGELRQLSRLLK